MGESEWNVFVNCDCWEHRDSAGSEGGKVS